MKRPYWLLFHHREPSGRSLREITVELTTLILDCTLNRALITPLKKHRKNGNKGRII